MFKRKYFIIFIILSFFTISLNYSQDINNNLDLNDFMGTEDDSQNSQDQEQTVPPQKKDSTQKTVKQKTKQADKTEESDFFKQQEQSEKKEKENQTQKEDEPKIEEEQDSKGGFSTPVRVSEDRTTNYITISGSAGLYYSYRHDLFADALLGDKSTGLDEDFFDPRVSLQIEAQLKDNISAVVKIENEKRVTQTHKTSLGNLYISNRSAEDQFDLKFEKAYFQIDNFLKKGLRFRAGIIPHKYSLRSNGDSFFLNFGEAESPFSTRGDTQAVGIFATYQPTKLIEFYIDGFYFVTSETSFSRRDESVFGFNFDFYLPKTVQTQDGNTITLVRLFNFIFTGIQGDNDEAIWSIGAGCDYFFSSDPALYLIELYGEALFQFGEYKHNDKDPFSATKDQDHLAFGGYIGGRYSYEKNDYKPFFDVSAWYISGDDDDPNRETNNDLVTYEDINTTLIVEENDYGLDVDSNYWAVKFKTGIKLNPILNEEVRLEFLYAFFQAIDVAPSKNSRIGDEFDIRITWEYTSDLVFSVAGGVLLNSDYFKDVYDEEGLNGKDHTYMIRIESMLRF